MYTVKLRLNAVLIEPADMQHWYSPLGAKRVYRLSQAIRKNGMNRIPSNYLALHACVWGGTHCPSITLQESACHLKGRHDEAFAMHTFLPQDEFLYFMKSAIDRGLDWLPPDSAASAAVEDDPNAYLPNRVGHNLGNR